MKYHDHADVLTGGNVGKGASADDVTLSDDELRAIADEACKRGLHGSVTCHFSPDDIPYREQRAWAEGVVNERKRARAADRLVRDALTEAAGEWRAEAATVRALAVKLVRTSVLLRAACRIAYSMSFGAEGSQTHSAFTAWNEALNECRAAGLLSSESEE